MQKFCDLHYLDSHPTGEGYSKIILFIHGNISNSVYYEPVCSEISNQDKELRLVRVDLRGLGKSQSLTKVDSIMDLTLDVENFIRTVLKLDDEQAQKKLILVGWSLGTMVSMQLAATFPNLIRKMLLVCSAPINGLSVFRNGTDGEICSTKEEVASNITVTYMQNIIQEKNAAALTVLFDAYFFNSGKKPDLQKMEFYMEETFKQSNYADTMWAIQQFDLTPTGSDTAKNIQGPVKVIHGKIDLLVTMDKAERIINEIGQNKCQLIVAENCGHMIPLEDPAFLAKEILEFVKQ